ncbi:hypothetical protein DENSPDRAFT_872952 [Dentipellis sp. KUC8613]|nr:hypothetical protein DENSPDRAFT_872952 [Dentipellis sp. KUC8613]
MSFLVFMALQRTLPIALAGKNSQQYSIIWLTTTSGPQLEIRNVCREVLDRAGAVKFSPKPWSGEICHAGQQIELDDSDASMPDRLRWQDPTADVVRAANKGRRQVPGELDTGFVVFWEVAHLTSRQEGSTQTDRIGSGRIKALPIGNKAARVGRLGTKRAALDHDRCVRTAAIRKVRIRCGCRTRVGRSTATRVRAVWAACGAATVVFGNASASPRPKERTYHLVAST